MITISGDRAPTFLFIIYLFAYYIISQKKKYYLILLSSLSIIFLIVLSLNSSLKDRLINQTISDFGLSEDKPGYSFNKKGVFFFSPHHEKLFYTSINIFEKNKFFGIGPNNFRHKCEENEYKETSENHYNCYNHPHNLYLQILAETGIFSFIFFVLFYLFFLKKYLFYLIDTFKNNPINYRKYLIFLIISVLINFFPITPSGNFFNNNLSIFNFLSVALFFSYLNKKQQSANE